MALRHATLTGSHVGRANVVLKRHRDALQLYAHGACLHAPAAPPAHPAWPLNHSLPARPSDLTFSPGLCARLPGYLRFCPTVVHSFRQRRTHIRFCCLRTPSPSHPADSLFRLRPCLRVTSRIAIIVVAFQYRLPPVCTAVIIIAHPPLLPRP
jgi:hypothetical protein